MREKLEKGCVVCAHQSPGDLVEMQILIPLAEVWVGC